MHDCHHGDINADLQEKQKRRAPLSDVMPRHSQVTPLALPSLSTPFTSSRAGPASTLVTPAAVAVDNVEEQCLSAGRWLRGLAEECVDNMYTPIKPQPVHDTHHQPQVLCNYKYATVAAVQLLALCIT